MQRIISSALLCAGLLGTVLAISWLTQRRARPATQHAIHLTFPLKAGSVRFAVIGDTRSGDTAQYETASEMEAMQEITKFSFVITLGDNLSGGHSSREYLDKFERPYGPLLKRGVMFYASLGNHDNTNEIYYAPFNMNDSRYYTFTKQNVQFFVLDSMYMDADQLSWLKNALQSSRSSWKIAYFHYPLYSSGKAHGSDTELRAVLEPLFQTYGVNVVLSGHDHVYERIRPQNGIVYFVLGNSGMLRAHNLRRNGIKAAGFDTDLCFMLVQVYGNTLYFQTISRTGATVDFGSFQRQGDLAPAVTERR